MTNKVKISKLVQFMNDIGQWSRMNPNNAQSPIATCINQVIPSVQVALKPLNEEADKYNKILSKLKADHADTVTITENSQSPEHTITAYNYKGEQLAERNRAIQAEWDVFTEKRKAIEEQEVEIEVSYVKAVPPVSILPPNFITSMRGIVIDPAYDSNIKIIRPIARA